MKFCVLFGDNCRPCHYCYYLKYCHNCDYFCYYYGKDQMFLLYSFICKMFTNYTHNRLQELGRAANYVDILQLVFNE